MTEAAPKTADWSEANRLLGDLAASLGVAIARPLGEASDDDWSERAAIMEYDGGLPREAAVRFARELAALGPEPSPEALAGLDRRLRALEPGQPSPASARARRP